MSRIEYMLMNVQVGIPGGVPRQSAQSHKAQHEHAHRPKAETGTKKPVNVFFGGETGTCESLAQQLSEKAPDYGECPHQFYIGFLLVDNPVGRLDLDDNRLESNVVHS